MKIRVVGSSEKKLPQKVYVLQLQGGYVYVGKTSDVQRRLKEHMSGKAVHRCASFTKLHKPTGKLLKRLGDLRQGSVTTDGPERDETLRWMRKLGPQKVRGWKYVRKGMLKSSELKDIESNIRELFDLCRKCGKEGHFATECKKPVKKKARKC